MSDREESPLIDRKRHRRPKSHVNSENRPIGSTNRKKKPKKNKNKKRKLNVNNNGDNMPKKRMKILQLTQSVCCPICIANISILSEFEADNHISQCMAMYEQMKRQRNENAQSNHTSVTPLHQQRRQNKIKHTQVVNEWKNIFNHKTVSNNNKTNKPKKKKQNPTFKYELPAFKKLRGTNIIINSLNYDTVNNINNGNSVHFLTHFRSEYYIGITSQWNKPIYCSQTCAKLLKHMFSFNNDIIHALPMNKQILIPHSNPVTFVTLLDSNNFMNGSVNLLFQITNNRSNNNAQMSENNTETVTVTVNGHKNMSMRNWLVPSKEDSDTQQSNEIIFTDMYCCDFYLSTNDMSDYFENNQLKGVNVRNLYLDTTYFHKKYRFIAQKELFRNLGNTIDDLLKTNDSKKICVVFGITFIERINLLIYASKRFNQKIYVNKTKKKLLSLLDLTKEENDCFSIEFEDTKQFRTMSLENVNFKNLNKIINGNDDFERVVGVKLRKPNGVNSNVRKMTKKDVTLVTVPHSDHCSFEELKKFTRNVDPLKIIPTANLKESTKYITKYCKT